jgi:tetratricopeptide (TPR) repeat protein
MMYQRTGVVAMSFCPDCGAKVARDNRFCPKCGFRLGTGQETNGGRKTDYDRAVHLNPNCADAYCKRGDFYYEATEYVKALADYNRAVELAPNDADAYYNRGCTYGEMGECGKAIAEFNKAIQLNHNHTLAYYNRGLAHHDMEEYDKAIADYDKAIELDPSDADAYCSRGLAYHDMEEYDRAIADYDKAIELDPSDADAYYNRGLAYHEKGEVLRALSDLEQCIGLSADPELTEDVQRILSEIIKDPLQGLTPEEHPAQYVEYNLASGKGKGDITMELVERGWTEEMAAQFVGNTEQELKKRLKEYKRTPEGRQAMARQYKRHMLNGILSVAGGIAVTIVTYIVAVLGAGFYIVALGAVIFGIISFFRGLIGWLKYKG